MSGGRRFAFVFLALLLASCTNGTPSALRPSPSSNAAPSSKATVAALKTKKPAASRPAAPKPHRPRVISKKPAAPKPRGFVMPRFSRVIVVVMENKEYGSIIGNSNAPYINSLANRYGLATNFFGAAHPSLPNYLAVTGGSTFGITSNCTDCHVNAPNITTQLEEAGISWKAYIEGLPEPCSTVAQDGNYAKKHNPFMYYDDIVNNPARCKKVVPLGQLETDRQSGKLPQFIWVTPDMCHSMHDCSVQDGDAWLSHFVPTLLGTLGSRGVLFLTFDEGNSSKGCCSYAAGGHIATVVAGPGSRAKTKSSVPYSLYSLLRTVEDSWRLGRLQHAGCGCTADMRALIDSA